MDFWLAIYHFFARQRFALLFLVLVIAVITVKLSTTQYPDQSLKSLLPDSSPYLRQTVELIELAPFSKVIFLELSATNPKDVANLVTAAETVKTGLDSNLMTLLDTSADAWPDAVEFMGLLPSLCDDDCLNRLIKKIETQQFDQNLATLKTSLSTLGSAESFFWRADPLNFREEIFKKFPANQKNLATDPMTGFITSSDGRRLLLIIKPIFSMHETDSAIKLMDNIEGLLKTIPNGIKSRIVGAHRHSAVNARTIMHDLTLTMSLALIMLIVIYLTWVGSLAALWLFLTPIVAVMVALAGVNLILGSVSGLAIGFGAAVLGIAEDYAVHVHFALRRTNTPEQAFIVSRPLLMSTLLSIGGFVALGLSVVPAIRQLALFSTLAIIAGYVWAMVVLPHCPGMNSPREVTDNYKTTLYSRRKNGPIWAVFFGLLIVTIFLSIIVRPDFSIRSLGLSSEEINSDQKAMEFWGFQGSGQQIYMAEGSNTEEALALASELATYFKQEKTALVSTLSDICPPLQNQALWQAKFYDYAQKNGPELRKHLNAEAEKQGFRSGAFEPFFKWFLFVPVSITPASLRKIGFDSVVDAFLTDKAGRFFAMVAVENSSLPLPEKYKHLVFSLSAEALEHSLTSALSAEKRLPLIAAAICLVILWWSFKDVAMIMLAFIPALAAIAAVLGFKLVLGSPLGLAGAAALPLVICLGADYGIVVVSEFKEKVQVGADKAIFVSGLSTIAGIGILILATHPVLKSLGQTVFVGLSVAMPFSIWVLPKLYYQK